MPKTKTKIDNCSGNSRIEQIKSEILSCYPSPKLCKAEVVEWNSIFETETEDQ